MLGSLTIYSAAGDTFQIKVGGGAAETVRVALVMPNTPVSIHASGRNIDVILVEPEAVPDKEGMALLAACCRQGSSQHRQLQRAFLDWSCHPDVFTGNCAEVDMYFFGTVLRPRDIDPRILQAVLRINLDPGDRHIASEFASAGHLSCSRFVHLFREELGTTFRSFCAWKRARAMLHHVAEKQRLTDVAMEMGYPDSTHFSHSIRRIYGLRPRDIFAGSRRLTVHSRGFDSNPSLKPQHLL
jgi:AraC-like DNA-binding protein